MTDRTISLADRYERQTKELAMILMVTLIVHLITGWNVWYFILGYFIGSALWPLVWHKIRLGEPHDKN